MRGLTDLEHQELSALAQLLVLHVNNGARDERERTFHGPTLDNLEQAGRIERFDLEGDGSYRLRATETGTLALRIRAWIRVA